MSRGSNIEFSQYVLQWKIVAGEGRKPLGQKPEDDICTRNYGPPAGDGLETSTAPIAQVIAAFLQ